MWIVLWCYSDNLGWRSFVQLRAPVHCPVLWVDACHLIAEHTEAIHIESSIDASETWLFAILSSKEVSLQVRYGRACFAKWQWRAATDNRFEVPATEICCFFSIQICTLHQMSAHSGTARLNPRRWSSCKKMVKPSFPSLSQCWIEWIEWQN